MGYFGIISMAEERIVEWNRKRKTTALGMVVQLAMRNKAAIPSSGPAPSAERRDTRKACKEKKRP